MADVLHLVPPDGVGGAALRHVVDGMAVSPGDDGGIIGGFGPALDLQAVHSGVHEVVQMVDHAHITGVHDVGTLFVLEHREVFAGALLLHQGVLVAAGLGAGAPVGVPAGHVIGEQTAAGVGHAHGPVAEGLQLQLRGGAAADLTDLVHAQLTGQHHSLGAQIVPRLSAGVVGDGLLGADVAFTAGSVFSRQREGPQIRQNESIHPGIVQALQMGGEGIHLAAAGHGIDGDVDPDAVVMGIGHRKGQLLRGEIPGEGAHPEGGACQIHGVGSIGHGHFQLFHVPGRGQQLRLFSHHIHQSGAYISLLTKARCSS